MKIGDINTLIMLMVVFVGARGGISPSLVWSQYYSTTFSYLVGYRGSLNACI